MLISEFSKLPIFFLEPIPSPNTRARAPLPLVFQGTFGFNRTSLGGAIRSKSESSDIISVINQVVQPPSSESVSSIPICNIITYSKMKTSLAHEGCVLLLDM